jgi:hypothetical protein
LALFDTVGIMENYGLTLAVMAWHFEVAPPLSYEIVSEGLEHHKPPPLTGNIQALAEKLNSLDTQSVGGFAHVPQGLSRTLSESPCVRVSAASP